MAKAWLRWISDRLRSPDSDLQDLGSYGEAIAEKELRERGYQIIDELWEATLLVVSECPCIAGCPSCVQSPKCGNNNYPLDKGLAVDMLRALATGT